mmetsp:Transcript_3562/g.8674  ORF Transcript_3562/g.8674 Transcript_3562/m.8674 type:complete len:208 (+) Transcript_3562:712-1335(+)
MIGGFFSSARAMATRCFSPPLRRSPRSPTNVWYPSAHCSSTNLENCAALAAFTTSSRVPSISLPSLPKAMLYSMVSLNSTQSCGTMPMLQRTLRCVHSAMFLPLMSTCPPCRSYSRYSSLLMVLLPAPLLPTMATFSPGATSKDTPLRICRISFGLYENCTLENSTRACDGDVRMSSGAPGASATSWFSRSSLNIASTSTMHCLIMR